MKIPGFTAETSLRTSRNDYRRSSNSRGERSLNGGVIASLQRVTTTGCGACVELKWPNGTGTGACMQNCCDALGKCEFKACSCGGGAAGGGGIARSFNTGSFLTRR
jgi:hypothetical protein